MTASPQACKEDSIANHSELRSRLEELAAESDSQTTASTWGSRVMEALLSPLRRALVDPVVDVQRQTIALLFDFNTALTEVSARLEQYRAATDATAEGVELMRGDSERTIEHLAALQEDHTRVRETMAKIVAKSERTIEHLAALQEDHTRVRETMAKIVAKSERTVEHLAALQEDHTRVREKLATIAVETEEYSAELKKIDDLWADLHRDMTALAEAFSRLESD